MFLFLKSVLDEITEFKIEKEDGKCVVQEAPSKLKISSVFRLLEPFDKPKSEVKLEPGEITATPTASQPSVIKIMTPSQINKPLDIVVKKKMVPPKQYIIGRVGNTTVKPIHRFLSNEPYNPSVTSQPPFKIILNPKENYGNQTAVSRTYVKVLEDENHNLRKLLLEVRRESVGKFVEI